MTDAYHIESHRHHNHEEIRREELLERVRNALHEGKPEEAAQALLAGTADGSRARAVSADSQSQAQPRRSGLSPLLSAALPPTGASMSPRLLRNPGLQEHLARVFPGYRSFSERSSRSLEEAAVRREFPKARSQTEGSTALLAHREEGPQPFQLPEGAQNVHDSTPSCPPTAGSSFELQSIPWTEFDRHLDGLIAATRQLPSSENVSAINSAIEEMKKARNRALS